MVSSILAKLPIAAKILSVLAIMAVATVVVAGSALWSVDRLESASNSVNRTAAEAKIGARMNQDLIALSRAEYRVGVDPSQIGSVREKASERREDFRTQLEEARAKASGAEAERLDEISAAYDAYVEEFERTLQIAEGLTDMEVGAERQKILDAIGESRDAAGALRDQVTAYVNNVDAKGTARVKAAEGTASTAQTAILAVSGIGLAAGLALGLIVSRSGIVRPLRQCVGAMKKLADGDLQTEIVGTGRRDEVGDIAGAMQVFKEQAQETERLKQEQAEAEKRAEEEKRRTMNALADKFEQRWAKSWKPSVPAARN
jgi:methyl-accepting chemotaxis protein